MALGKQEKLSPHEKAGKGKRDAKRFPSKKMRQEVRRDAEEAPKKSAYRGWSR